MKVLIETNIVLDVLLDRKPFSKLAVEVFSRIEQGQLIGLLGATTVTTIYYLIEKSKGSSIAKTSLDSLLQLFDIAPITRAILISAARLGFDDYEDAVLHEAAVYAGAQAIVTRDSKGFSQATIPVYSPQELVRLK